MSDELCKLYTLYVNGVPYEYRYGPAWVGKQLEVDGGYKTKQEAIEAWERYEQEKKLNKKGSDSDESNF